MSDIVPTSTATPTPSTPAQTHHSKRLRPLSLAIGRTQLSDQPKSAPAEGGGGTPKRSSTDGLRKQAGVKRMSSISYSPRRRDTESAPPTRRSWEDGEEGGMGSTLLENIGEKAMVNGNGNGNGNGKDGAERPAVLTLAEKHADLLHYIAQKEARTLELRTQLAQSERELLTLKRKWEGIVARSGLASTSSTTISSTAMGGVGEALREGTRRIIHELVFDAPPPFSPVPTPVATLTSTSVLSKTAAPRPVSMASSASTDGTTPALSRTSSDGSTEGGEEITPTPTPPPLPPSPSVFSPLTPATSANGAVPLTAGPTLQALTSTLGKKWDEIRGSDTYTASTKRASLFLSSLPSLGSLAAPLTPSPSSPAPSLTRTLSQSSQKQAKPKPPAMSPNKSYQPRAQQLKTLTPSSQQVRTSLLDDELFDADALGVSQALVPHRSPQTAPSPLPATITTTTTTGDEEDEDVGWNW